MPITGPSSWLSTIDEFTSHWVQCNAALPTPLILTGAYSLASMTTARGTLATAETTYATSNNDRQVLSSNVALLEAGMIGKVGDFNRAVRAFLSATAYAAAMGKIPGKTSAQGKFEKAMDDANSLWVKINSVTLLNFTPPLVLRGGFIQSQFASLVTNLKAAYTPMTNAERIEKVLIEQRNAAFVVIRPRLVEYRKAVMASFAPGSPMVLSLPRYSPRSGRTPLPVSATGQWNIPAVKARLQWSASDNPDLAHYSIRWCTGTRYKAANEQVAGLAEPGTLNFETDAGLVSPGVKAVFKVYVVLASGNERGSNGVKIERPL